jgi:hypothetical protein
MKKSHHHYPSRPPFLLLFCLLGLALCLFGTYQASKKARGYFQYSHLKHDLTDWDKLEDLDIEAIDDIAEKSLALAPENFMLCQHMADLTYHARGADDGVFYFDRISLSRYWVDKGLMLNPFDRGLIHRKVDLLEKEYDLDGAIELLTDYTEWEFWHPFNHARLSQLYTAAGNLAKAEEELAWVKGSEYYAYTRSVFEQARKKKVVSSQ